MKSQTFEYQDGATKLVGFLTYDDDTREPRPGIVLMPEIWGLGDHARDRAQRLAALGYVVLAGDPYGNGAQFDSLPEAMKLARVLREDADRLRNRIRAALDALAAHPAVDATRMAAMGYCMGGSLALELARSGAPIQAVVAFHANLATLRPARPAGVMAKLLICTGADDTHVSWEQVKSFIDEMGSAGVDYTVNIYSGAKHGFTIPGADRRGIPGLGYNATADARSWRAMVHFLDEVFGTS